MARYKEIQLDKIKTSSIAGRNSKVGLDMLATPFQRGQSFDDFWKSLPAVLASNDLKAVAAAVVAARKKNKPVLVMMGAHVIKVGLSPIFIDLMEQGMIQGIALNGAGAIHDMELAYYGKTSEDVGEAIRSGDFGMSQETSALLNDTVIHGSQDGSGFGEALGKRVLNDNPPFGHTSILGQAYRMEIPVTVHVALGTDIVHQHPGADGAAIGSMSLRDFRIWAEAVAGLDNGGVLLLFGSCVVLPEVFLKALTVARNIYGRITGFTTASFDMIRHYRPRVNVVERPNQESGRGYMLVGHHEIMIPFLAAGIKTALK